MLQRQICPPFYVTGMSENQLQHAQVILCLKVLYIATKISF